MGVPVDILVGVGRLYIAEAGTAKPALGSAPGVSWRELGETKDGVKIVKSQNIEAFSSDQRTGKVKAVRTEEGLTVETNLLENTLENYADVINSTVTTTDPGSGTIGTKSVKLHSGSIVDTYALLFRGESPYVVGAPGQFYVPIGYMDDDVEMEFIKDGETLIPVKYEALEDPDAATEDDRFGVVEYQHAAALP